MLSKREREYVSDKEEFGVKWGLPYVRVLRQRIKAKAGKELVGKWTGNWVASFNSTVNGLRGTIRGGGKKYAKLQLRWRVGDLFMAYRAKRTREIIENEVKKRI